MGSKIPDPCRQCLEEERRLLNRGVLLLLLFVMTACPKYQIDEDSDGYSACSGECGPGEDCDDTLDNIYPDAKESCDHLDNNCDGNIDEGFAQVMEVPYDGIDQNCDGDDLIDVDDDGFAATTVGGPDCDDGDPNAHPSAVEVACDGIDQDCDGADLLDADGDTYSGIGCGENSGEGLDCDDSADSIYPGAPEIPYDSIDQDCDGIDVTDVDGDGYAAEIASGPDCDDETASVHPAAVERCDGMDQDCDGVLDNGVTTIYYPDADGDGYGGTSPLVSACAAPEGHVDSGTDCNDDDKTIHPEAVELCDALDNDCDESADEDFPAIPYYLDADLDLFGRDDGLVAFRCEPPREYSRFNGDCNDGDNSVYPNAEDENEPYTDSDCGGTTDDDPGVDPNGVVDDLTLFATLQAALDAVSSSNVTVWVAPAVYEEVELTFRGKTKVTLRSIQGAAETIIDAKQRGTVMVFVESEDNSTVLDGFTLTGGTASNRDDLSYGIGRSGGGVFILNAEPTLQNLVISGNSAEDFGGGVVILQSNRTQLVHVVLKDNIARNGGGIFGDSGSGHDLTIQGNTALELGGGIYGQEFYSSERLRFTGLTLRQNTAGDLGGGFYGSLYLYDALIEENTATHGGGGGYLWGDMEIKNTAISENEGEVGSGLYFSEGTFNLTNVRVRQQRGVPLYLEKGRLNAWNLLVVDNQPDPDFGALFLYDPWKVTLTNSIVYGNTGAGGKGIVGYLSSPDSEPVADRVTLLSSIVACNEGGNLDFSPNLPPTIAYSNLYPAQEGVPSDSNFSLEPIFLTPESDFPEATAPCALPTDFHLPLDSPFIDTGDPGGQNLDVDGSRSDIGIYGGPNGSRFDRDLDAFPDYFWPGTYHQVPVSFQEYIARYDADDSDPERH